MKLKRGMLFEHNGVTIQIDWIKNGVIGYAKYRGKIGDRVGMSEFMGWFRTPAKNFKTALKKEIVQKDG